MTKYVEEFCEYTGYRSLMPIKYITISEGVGIKEYKKLECDCKSIMKTTCIKQKSCKHFVAAEEIIKE
jgi:hypothetical protein